MAVSKSLDEKLRSIHADPHGSPEFIIADAKDADMAFGMSAPGLTRTNASPETHDAEVRFKTLAEYRDQIRQVHGEFIAYLFAREAPELGPVDFIVHTQSAISQAQPAPIVIRPAMATLPPVVDGSIPLWATTRSLGLSTEFIKVAN